MSGIMAGPQAKEEQTVREPKRRVEKIGGPERRAFLKRFFRLENTKAPLPCPRSGAIHESKFFKDIGTKPRS
jgi:hypothetical protein